MEIACDAWCGKATAVILSACDLSRSAPLTY